MLIHAWCQHTQGMVLHPVLLIAERLFYSAQLRDRFCDTATDRRLVYQLDIRYRATRVRYCFPIIEAPQAQVVDYLRRTNTTPPFVSAMAQPTKSDVRQRRTSIRAS